MNNEIKILLSVELQGGTLVRKSDYEEIHYSVREKDFDSKKKWKGDDGMKSIKKGIVKHYPLEAKPALYHIDMTKDAYEYMISSEYPSWSNMKKWKHMNINERLNAHMQRICDSYGGNSFTYVVLPD